MTLLRLERVAKLFGPFAALRDASASFESGKLYLITGENGAGKSTLMRMIAGLTHPSRGKIERHFELSELGYMAHATMLYDELTGMENLHFFARLYGAPDENCTAAMLTVGLDPALARPAGQYSQGMRQRLALARAILNSPKLLLLDEPFSNLDVKSAEHMVQVLATQRDAGRCILIVTHQASLLANVADMHLHIESGVMRVVTESRSRDVTKQERVVL
jgi:ABC-type multidrug transport system ATPase subunit